jgi:hypothetical protein
VSLFQAVRLFSAFESVVFASLLVVWLGHIDERAEFVLGLTHGVGFLCLCALIYVACLRRALPWPVLASAVLLTPFGSTVHIELLRRRRPASQRQATGAGAR